MLNKLSVDLNDLYFFAQVVDRHGFTAASKVINVPKSRLSRRITELEKTLGVRLLQRNSRKLALTEVGTEFYRHCIAMLTEAEAAEYAVQRTLLEPVGTVHLSAPISLGEIVIAELLPAYLRNFPKVSVKAHITNRPIDLIEEGIDIAFRGTFLGNSPQEMHSMTLIQSTLASIPYVLVASNDYLDQHGNPQSLEDLSKHELLAYGRHQEEITWQLIHQVKKEEHALAIHPKLQSDSVMLIKKAVLSGIGIAAMSLYLVGNELKEGNLQIVLPEWTFPLFTLNLYFPSKRGLVPAVRSCIDFFKTNIPMAIQQFVPKEFLI